MENSQTTPSGQASNEVLDLDSACIRNLPVPLFGSVMGLSGLSIALMRLDTFSTLPFVGWWLLLFTTGWFALLLVAYASKAVRFPERAMLEFNHPVRMHFFPAISISMLLLAIGYLTINPSLSAGLWWVGAVLHFVLLLRTLRVWFFRGLPLQTYNPSWWAYTFPLAAIALASIRYHAASEGVFFYHLGVALSLLLSLVVLTVAYRTIRAALNKTLCVAEM